MLRLEIDRCDFFLSDSSLAYRLDLTPLPESRLAPRRRRRHLALAHPCSFARMPSSTNTINASCSQGSCPLYPLSPTSGYSFVRSLPAQAPRGAQGKACIAVQTITLTLPITSLELASLVLYMYHNETERRCGVWLLREIRRARAPRPANLMRGDSSGARAQVVHLF